MYGKLAITCFKYELEWLQSQQYESFFILPPPPLYTVRKMGLILRSIERMLKMKFSMARNFTRQPLRR